MLMAIDAGNTNVVFALYEDRQAIGSWRISTDARRTADEYAVWLYQILAMAGHRHEDVTEIVVASVVPAATFNIEELCRKHFDVRPLVVTKDPAVLGIEILIDNPREAGIDRLVNIVAAKAKYPAPSIVVDIGTATTFDISDADGNYIGGVIAPGPHPSLEALHRIAAQLPKVEIVKPDRVIGKGTVGAMTSGLYWGYIGLIEGLLSRIQEEYGSGMTVIATGGLSRTFCESTSAIQHYDADLTIRGLVDIHERARSK